MSRHRIAQGQRHKFLFKNVSWLFIGRMTVRMVSLLILPVTTAYLKPEAYGIIALFLVQAAMLQGFFDLGLSNFGSRLILKYDRRCPRLCRQYLGVIIVIKLLVSLSVLAVCIPFSKMLFLFFIKDASAQQPWLYLVPVIYAFFSNFFAFFMEAFISLQNNKYLIFSEIFEFLLIVPLQIIGLVFWKFTWVDVVVLQLAARILGAGFGLFLLRKNIGFSWRRMKIFSMAMKYSLPLLPLNFVSWVQGYLEKIFLSRMQSAKSVGLFDLGDKFSNVFSMFSRPVVTTVKPEISKRLDGKDANIQKDLTEIFALFFQFSVFVVFTVSLFARELVKVFASAQYGNVFIIIPMMMSTYLFQELSGILNLKFIFKNRTIFYSFVTFFGIFCSIVLNYIFVSRFDFIGASFASMLSNFLTFLVTYYLSQHLHRSRYYLIRNFSVFILIAALFLFLNQYSTVSMIWLVIKLGIVFIYGLILVILSFKFNQRFQEIVLLVYDKINSMKNLLISKG
ncbi:MAG: oligosaccharide flippase family protein [Candidatus Omnitrophica bacterium]|nr:oligosaccharide flippase family protein [Candidatus Omnitrophota bacterium]